MTRSDRLVLLGSYLESGHRIATRLAASVEGLGPSFPLDAGSVSHLTAAEEERIDAFLHRFSSLAASVQDHIGRALLMAEEEDLSEMSRKDQRLLLEKLGALDPRWAFGFIAELMNKLVHTYPDDPAKQAEVLNQVYQRSTDLLSCFDRMTLYASHKFGVARGLPPVSRAPPHQPRS
jgi:hypothetical protein